VIDGLLTRPNDRDAAGPLPLVVSLHGGPSDAWSQSFVGRETQFGPLASLVAEGYAVLRCNVCGSTGYGPDFRRATAGAWGEQDAADVLAGIEALAARGLIDPDRVGLIGWSYGGFLAACLLSQSGRFRAAVVGAAMTDLVGYALGTDAPESIEAAFGGPLWESAARLLACSPAIRANRIRTPTLVVHGKLDRRVPVAQSIHFHRALQRVGCASELLVYPEVGHHPADPRVRRHLMRSMLDWFARYLPTAP
jgi:dipeptidyl aminopeptidase/acylaminoacyl peptidase